MLFFLQRNHFLYLSEFDIEAQEERHSEADQWSWEKVKQVSGGVNHLELTLQPYSTYRFRVIGLNEFGPSDPSQESESHDTPPAGENRATFRHLEFTVNTNAQQPMSGSLFHSQL